MTPTTLKDWLDSAPNDWDSDYKMIWAKNQVLQNENLKLKLEVRELKNANKEMAKTLQWFEDMDVNY